MTTQEPTRASLERAVDGTRARTGWYMEPPHRVTTSCMCGSCKALLAYGAACQALGEHIGREAAQANKIPPEERFKQPWCPLHGFVSGNHRCRDFDGMPWESKEPLR